ncbi:MAG: hypothetical protein QNL77_01480 [Akkermansiaceae bacterium]
MPAQPDPSILLRDHGIPVTAQRLAVMRSVSAHPHGTSPRHIPTAHPHGTSPRHIPTAHPHGTAEVIGDHVRSEIGATSTEPFSHSFA